MSHTIINFYYSVDLSPLSKTNIVAIIIKSVISNITWVGQFNQSMGGGGGGPLHKLDQHKHQNQNFSFLFTLRANVTLNAT